jgi:hypothetical protein
MASLLGILTKPGAKTITFPIGLNRMTVRGQRLE